MQRRPRRYDKFGRRGDQSITTGRVHARPTRTPKHVIDYDGLGFYSALRTVERGRVVTITGVARAIFVPQTKLVAGWVVGGQKLEYQYVYFYRKHLTTQMVIK